MRFQVLGPLRVTTASGAVTLGSAKRRSMLAILLLYAGEPVPIMQLATELWGDSEARRRNTIHWHIHQLRVELGLTNRIQVRDGGYSLEVLGGELDVHGFENLLKEAQRACGALNWTTASGLLRQAEQLWSGPAYADVANNRIVVGEATRLLELRQVAREHWFAVELNRGRDIELVADLAQLVAEYLYRDGLRSKLMLALYRCGRQVDALHVYREERVQLADDLGLDPGRELVKLERAILNQETWLDEVITVQGRHVPTTASIS